MPLNTSCVVFDDDAVSFVFVLVVDCVVALSSKNPAPTFTVTRTTIPMIVIGTNTFKLLTNA